MDAQKPLELVTNLALLILDPLLTGTVSQHIVLICLREQMNLLFSHPLKLLQKSALFVWSCWHHVIYSFFTRPYLDLPDLTTT